MTLPESEDPRAVEVTEYGYGLGDLHGILVQHHSTDSGQVRLPEVHDEYRHQLFWARDGWLAVRRGGQVSFAGPHQAVWVRSRTCAEIRGGLAHDVVTAFVRTEPAAARGQSVGLLSLDRSARTALARLGHGPLPEPAGLQARADLFDGLGEADPVPLVGSGRGLARTVAAAMMAEPSDPTDLATWADRLHVSSRTLQRDFEREYGTTFTHWRTRHRLEASLPLLGLHPVTRIAHLVGYATASAYVAAFHRHFGVTPGRHGQRGPRLVPALVDR